MDKASTYRKKLGELLVEYGIITQECLEEALEEQNRTGGKIGEILISRGYVTEDVLLAFLGKEHNAPYVKLSEYGKIPDEVIKTLPENVARANTLIPIEKSGDVLTVAVGDPAFLEKTDDLYIRTGLKIKPVLANEREIKEAIDKYYTHKGTMEDILEEMETEGKGTDVELLKEKEEGEASDVEAAEEAPVVKLVNMMLSDAVKARASDIHIEPYEKSVRVRYRIDGILHEVASPPKRLQNALISRIKIMSNLDIAEHRLPQDGRIRIKLGEREVDLRVSVLPTSFGEKVVMRILDPTSLCLDLERLGFEPDVLEKYMKGIDVPHGIILITGPTGSGKSTTLYTTLTLKNTPDVNIITIEDPVEYRIKGINQVQIKPEIGLTFSNGLRSFLRQDPDIVMVGEIRDAETAEIAINAALTGHLVFSTVHTNDAPGAVTRLTNMGVEPFLTTSTVSMVIAQRLMRVVCPKCKETYKVSFQKLKQLININEKDVNGQSEVTLVKGKGCENCTNTGYHGRTAIYEVLIMDDDLRDLVLRREPAHVLKRTAVAKGMLTLRDAAIRKMLAGITSIDEVARVTYTEGE